MERRCVQATSVMDSPATHPGASTFMKAEEHNHAT